MEEIITKLEKKIADLRNEIENLPLKGRKGLYYFGKIKTGLRDALFNLKALKIQYTQEEEPIDFNDR